MVYKKSSYTALVASIRFAVFTVSPNRQNRGIRSPKIDSIKHEVKINYITYEQHTNNSRNYRTSMTT